MKTKVALLLVGLIGLLLLAGCSSKPEEPAPATNASKVTLRLFLWTPADELAANQELVTQFESSHPNLHVELMNQPGHGSAAMQKLMTMTAGGDAPDVVSLHGAYFVPFASKGLLEELAPYLEKDSELKEASFHPGLIELSKYDGKLYSLPRYSSVYCIFYNKDLFDAAGIDYPKDDWTWDDYLKAAKALTVDTNGDGKPDQYGAAIDFWGARLYPWIWANGGQFFDIAKNRFTLTTPEVVGAIQFLVDLKLKHKVTPAFAEGEQTEAGDLFPAGNIAMYMTGAWAIQDLKNVSFKWDVVVFPKQKQSATLLGTENYAISSSSKHKQEAWELMRFLLSAKSQEFMAEKLDKEPSLLSVLRGSYLSAPVGYNRKAFVDSLDFGQMAPNIPQYNEVSHYWQEQLDSIWIGDVKVKDGLAEAERDMNKLLAEEAP